MITIRYPSKEFHPFAQTAIEEGKTFCVDARLGKFRKKSLQDFINNSFHHKSSGYSYIGVAMCGMLASLTAKADLSGHYCVEYTDSKGGLLITFRCSKYAGQANSYSNLSA